MIDPITDAAGPLLEVNGLTLEYRADHGWVRVVENVTFSVRSSRTLALVGESGSGKTVSATAVLGLVGRRGGRISSGSIMFEGRELVGLPEAELRKVRGKEISMIFQNPKRSLNPAYTVGEQIAEVAREHLALGRRAAHIRAIEMLEVVGIPDPSNRVRDYPHMFSGGMAQRLSIAIALCGDPKLLIADEPTTALDVTVQARVLALMREIQERTGVAIIFISHDLAVVAEVADDVAVMYAGEVVESGSIEDVFLRPQHPYTSGLLGSIPVLGAGSRGLRSIPGIIPTPGHWPAECRFTARCSHAVTGRCDQQHPPIVSSQTDPSAAVRCLRADELRLDGVHLS